jgi:NAD(P)-binding Rossmann-like domain
VIPVPIERSAGLRAMIQVDLCDVHRLSDADHARPPRAHADAEALTVRIAVVGAAISGLRAAHLLQREHEIVVYESNPYAGGGGARRRLSAEGERCGP